MTRIAALLRGVNVGGNKKIAMADFRTVLSDLGYDDVRTLLQSGNAVFSAKGNAAKPAAVEKRIEKALADLGLTTRCLARTADELQAVIDGHPLVDLADNGSRMLAVFLSEDLDPALADEVVALAPDHIRIGSRVVYQWCPDGILQAPELVPLVAKRTKIAATARNWNTVVKIGAAL
ncbi:Uncharacterized conserved protein, DUF1697 family [Actinokineospora alba]|uniref:Uncharacterized conserved protein, DUF1697 family n=1 Tax=Actinokineospora alba TaxID=504798 RepID=A0A1H0WAY4_9PSEU|nr:DUF1697 domain-containing protein [Actinokineospora alba]TDP66183.1 uncharacterized protein (DUF1697 family) [Actinokineospora alba]SDJ42333.1 Uncharacterized conserved protein, DUF1697 family [Actinokineospora alba]SDP87595.1 Uncharacterized conserved protein, DUF1697 family [Actinokineospora alba]